MSNQELNDLSEEQKEKIINEVNAESDSEESGNTSIFTLDEISESVEPSDESAQAQYEKAISANAQSLYILEQVLNSKSTASISRKNLVKLIFATLKLPEEGATLKFGGTRDQQQMCEFAYAQMQLANNCKAFILGVNAMRQARQVERAKAEAAKSQESQSSEEGAPNE